MSTIGTARNACADSGAFHYQRHRPEKTLLYHLVSKHYPDFRRQLAEEGGALPDYVQREFEDYLKCGRLEHGFLRVRCETCHGERLVAFSCKRWGFCPNCGARRMAESSALLVDVDDVFPHQPVRQWVLSFPFQLRFLFASRPLITGQVLGIVYRVISLHLLRKAGYSSLQIASSIRVQISVILISSVWNRSLGRTSHHSLVASSITPVPTRVSTRRRYSP